MTRLLLAFGCFLAAFSTILAQNEPNSDPKSKYPNGGWATIEVIDGDTLYVATIRSVNVQSTRTFKNAEDQRRYQYWKRCAAKVYPYAVEAVKLYQEVQEETEDMSRRKRKKHVKKNYGELQDSYEDQLKKLTKTQGHILIKMIERYTGDPFYDVIKETKGGFTAMYWNGLGKMWGYQLKDEYEAGKDPILDAVLTDFDLSMSLQE